MDRVPFQPSVMWVEFVVSVHLAPRDFLQVLPFSSLKKNQHLDSKFQFKQDRGPTWQPAMADVDFSLNIVIYVKP